MNIHYYTLGCKVNQYETEALKEAFAEKGHTSIHEASADIILINSCTVTAESDRKTRQLLRRCRRENKNAVIILTGCMVQAFPEKAKKLIEADVIIGNKNTSEIISAAEKYFGEKCRQFCVSEHQIGDTYNTLTINDFSERTRAYMKIEDGCDRYCSYCIIPYARGHVRSRSKDSIKNEAQRLADNGYKEIVLVGINLSAYGRDIGIDLCDAVDTVSSVDGIERIRLGSLEPDHISDEMLSRFSAQKKFCPQFHLSLQSGCDETLKRMNRHYDSDFYYDLVTRIRKVFRDASITTDIMVGFVGESEDEFRKSLAFVKKVQFSRSHIFIYSQREGTVSAALDGQIPNDEKESRAKQMSSVTTESEKEFLLSECGKIYPVLFEAPNNGFAEGYTPNYSKIKVKSEEEFTGLVKDVRIIASENDYCIGEFV